MINSENIKNLPSISITYQDIERWINLGLMPEEFKKREMSNELFVYLNKNAERLIEASPPDKSNDPFINNIPPQSEWHKGPDLLVTDKRTGKITQVLHMVMAFKLCKGVTLHIQPQELEEWQKETNEVNHFDKEQHELLIETLKKIGDGKSLSKQEIANIIQEIRRTKSKNKTFRQSSEIINNKLDRELNENELIVDFFDPKISKNLEELKSEKPIIKGLDLDQAEDAIIHVLTLLLSRNSENKNQKSENYYMGNHSKGLVSINDIEMETARMVISPHELYSTYYGRSDYNSNHIKFILNKLDILSKKMFLTTWNIPVKGKSKKYNKFRTYCPLFTIGILNLDLTEDECQDIDNNNELLEGKKCHFVFKFQPQFTNNIRERYVEFPEDIHLRIREAAGKDRYSQCINLMRDFLFREKQQKRYEIIRDKETLLQTLKLDKFWKEKRKATVNLRILECFSIFMKIGLIKKWEELQGKFGQDQYRILINPDFK